MAIAAVIVPIGVLFFVSGLLVNLIQPSCCGWNLCGLLIGGRELRYALVIANHKSDIDWLIGWVFAQRSGCLGSTLAVMKKSSKFLPVIGWSMWFSEYLFLERKWAKDESTRKAGLHRLKDYPQPFWLALFVEGTRFTNAKLLAAQEYASSMGLPGFVTSVSEMRSFASAIYDMTVAIPKDSTPPTMLRLFKGQSSVIHVKVKRHLMKDLPETDEGVAQWCKDIFVAKDDLLDKHKLEDSFPDSELHDIGRPLKSLVGLTFTTIGLGIIIILMQILIQFSQSERSTAAKVAPTRSSNGNVQEKLH
ncbi:hypothetical protein L1987_21433 [Smallanthus sonchifolius]|uniref:Uncharacterized protein n=1 Tax=Smallanthus sonchifolius TaxID=185202 RepID=A0ACB9ITW3_9ASTR|nr:hypothetical protein L1987_21433 [Smallanthus sonchifolius]